MSAANELRDVVSTMLMLPAAELVPETSLQTLSTSLGGARLGLALKRAGLQLPGNRVPATFGELEAAVNGGGSLETLKSAPPGHSPPPAGLQLGLDVQEIGGFPIVDDYWEHEFYRETFDRSEIAYAVGQSEPRIHLAGFWCAKEALRKCDPSFAGANPASTAVAHDDSGRPYLLSVTSEGRVRLPHSLSISHSGAIATAMVAIGPALPERAPEESRVPSLPPPREGKGTIAIALASLSLAFAIAALLYSFR